MLLNGRISVPEDEMPDPVRIDFDAESAVSEVRSRVQEFTEAGYAGSDEDIAENIVPTKSPVYTTRVLRPEDALGEKTFDDEVYTGRSIEDRARMDGLATEPNEVIERLEDGYVYLMAVAHASDSEVSPEFRVAEASLEAELLNREENLKAMGKVNDAIEDLGYGIDFYDHTLWTNSYGEPEGTLEEARNSELKFTASVYTSTPFHIDIGYLSSPQEEGSEFGIEFRNRASKSLGESPSDENIIDVAADLVETLSERGFDFGDQPIEISL